jgi:hypothetical protein
MESMQPTNNPTRRTFIKSALLASAPLVAGAPASAAEPAPASDRAAWLAIVERVSNPVLAAISRQQLRATMPVECRPGDESARAQSTHLEAIGRLLCGLAPWLESDAPADPAETQLRTLYRDWSRLAIRYGCDPASPDALNFGANQQSLVDAAFLALAVLRAPRQLWAALDATSQQNLLRSLRATRALQPGPNNWLLFSGLIEALFCKVGQPWDAMRIDYGLRQLDEWYKGDGLYGDGAAFHWDYYNSFVVQPFLLNILDALGPNAARWQALREPILQRARRYAAIQERLISPEATFPAIGRSLAYRFGAFHHLAEIALRHQLPEAVHPAQVRSALTAVMTRMIAAPGTFDAHGWLTIGFAGHQPSIGEPYISTGSLYLCSAAWLPLGLPATDPFWSAPPVPWTARQAWSGVNIPTDHAITV